jgi:hypothetical protein
MTSGPAVAITTGFFTALAFISVFMRLAARLVLLKNGGRDEIAIVISVVRCAKSYHHTSSVF